MLPRMSENATRRKASVRGRLTPGNSGVVVVVLDRALEVDTAEDERVVVEVAVELDVEVAEDDVVVVVVVVLLVVVLLPDVSSSGRTPTGMAPLIENVVPLMF